MPEEIREEMYQKFQSPSSESRAEQQARFYNASVGDLPGFYCEKCKNNGFIAYAVDDECRLRECLCMQTRRVQENMRESGLGDLLGLYTFDNYETPDLWRETTKNRALEYVSDFSKKDNALKWFCVFGAVGSGKTHICTAICNKILKNGGKVAYMLWREESVKLKAVINDYGEYKRIFKPFKEANTLYIDDFLKCKKEQSPTEADINLAFELINHRYYMPGNRTIISSEKTFDEISEFDEAIGSRISQRSGQYYSMEISQGDGKNWRLRA